MRSTTSLLLNVVGLGWTAIAAAQPSPDDLFPRGTGWGEATTTATEWVTVVVPTTIYPPTITDIISVTEVWKTTETDTVTTPTTIIDTVTTPTTIIDTVTTPTTVIDTVTTPTTVIDTVTTPTTVTDTVTTPTTVTDTVTTPTTIIDTVTTPTTVTDTVTTPTTITDTVTTPTTITDTVTTPTTITDTLTTATTAPIVLTVTTTSTLRITLCQTRDVNPTFTAPLPIPTDSTWGCPPGTICKPPQVNCNFERGLPSTGYSCSPDECIPVPALLPLQFWGEPVFSDSSPLSDDTLFFDITSGYFNMNPLDYDLSYDIFFEETVYTYTTTIYPPAATGAVRGSKRQQQLFVPPVCYDECNDAMLEAQTMGKTPALCKAGSAFEVTTSMCELCITVHTANNTAGFVQIQPQFEQFLDYCSSLSLPTSTSTPITTATVVPFVTTAALSETVTYASSTYTFIIPTRTVSDGLETIYPSANPSTGTTVVPEPTVSSSGVIVLSPTVTTLTTKAPATTPTPAISSKITTGPGPVSSSPPPSGLSTVPTLTSTVSTLSGSAPTSQGGSATTVAATAPTTSGAVGPASTISGTATTPAAPSVFTGAASKLSVPIPGAFESWALCWTGLALLLSGNL